MNFPSYVSERINRINKALENFLPAVTEEPKNLHKAMRYSVLNGGKRIRPLLVYVSGETFAANLNILDIPACAIEFIHCYSLIHDDLPAMDNDDWRRGKPTCHKAFNEATAVLAGDTLFNLAFAVITNSNLADAAKVNMIHTLTKASGSQGIAGGQMLDLESGTKPLTIQQLEHILKLKTGSLLSAAVKLGAIAANVTDSSQLENLDTYAECIGLAFQIQDDIFDNKETNSNGKSKTDYVSLLGINAAKNKLHELNEQAIYYLDQLNTDVTLLKYLTKYIMSREF